MMVIISVLVMRGFGQIQWWLFFPNILHFSWDYGQMHWWLFFPYDTTLNLRLWTYAMMIILFPKILYLIWDYGHMQWWLFFPNILHLRWDEECAMISVSSFHLRHEACPMMFYVFLFEMRHEACAIIFVISVFHMRHGAFAMMIIFWCYTISEWGMALKLGYGWGNYLCSYEMKYLEIMPFIF